MNSGPICGGRSMPMKPERHSVLPPDEIWSTYCSGVSTNSTPAIVKVTSGIDDRVEQTTIDSPVGSAMAPIILFTCVAIADGIASSDVPVSAIAAAAPHTEVEPTTMPSIWNSQYVRFVSGTVVNEPL
eukprot:Amastigsp_a509022_512.p4 type:complete len:128 gc:universal Amastigsp_a509022_512:112-495(+)